MQLNFRFPASRQEVMYVMRDRMSAETLLQHIWSTVESARDEIHGSFQGRGRGLDTLTDSGGGAGT